ncbi:MAG: hypothetical protein J0M02_13100, partial [Planctomycetes bacterium]|nr:hypothetical protein [Planctomycetota bacterium]
AEDPVAAARRLMELPPAAYAALCGAATDLYDAGYAPAGLRSALSGLADRIMPASKRGVSRPAAAPG